MKKIEMKEKSEWKKYEEKKKKKGNIDNYIQNR